MFVFFLCSQFDPNHLTDPLSPSVQIVFLSVMFLKPRCPPSLPLKSSSECVSKVDYPHLHPPTQPPHGACSSSAAITDSFVGADPALLTPSTIAFSDGPPYGGFVAISFWREKECSAGAQCPAALLPLCYLEVTPTAVLHIHQPSAVIFFFLTPGQKAIFILLKHDVQELYENYLHRQGWVCKFYKDSN